MIIFETTRLIVRAFMENDIEDFFAINGDEEVTRYIRAAKSREECVLFLQEVVKYSAAHPLFGRWAVYEKNTQQFVGSFAIIPIEHTDKMQLGYALLREFRGKGYATKLTKAGIDYFFSQTDFPIVYARVEAKNVSSINVLTRCGFTDSCRLFEAGKEVLEFSVIRNS